MDPKTRAFEENRVIHLRIDRAAARRVRHWTGELHVEDGMGDEGRR
jgi:hypothetical protein